MYSLVLVVFAYMVIPLAHKQILPYLYVRTAFFLKMNAWVRNM